MYQTRIPGLLLSVLEEVLSLVEFKSTSPDAILHLFDDNLSIKSLMSPLKANVIEKYKSESLVDSLQFYLFLILIVFVILILCAIVAL